MSMSMCLLGCLLVLLSCQATWSKQPHVVVFLADDLGSYDVSYNNPAVHSPTLASLAARGVILDQSYVSPLCTPTRASLLTGRDAHRTSLQKYVTMPELPMYLPTDLDTLPQKLKGEGYATHMVGKWHLGFCRWDATPTFRGFDTFFGFLGGGEDYYTHNATVLHTQPGNLTSWLDFRDQETADFSHNGVYSTEAFTERATRIIEQHDTDEPMFLYMPFQAVHSLLQVPEEYLQYYDHIDDPTRKQYLAMVTSMDEAIGKVVESLEARDMWDDTLIVFLSDNGGNAVGGGSNFPYRGAKVTLFEGGTRVPTLVAGGILERTGYRHDGLFSMTDWYSTILSLAGVHDDDLGDIDGIDQSEMLLHGAESQRHEVLYHIDETDVAVQGRAAIRLDNYKLFYGFPGAYQGWYTPPELNGTSPLDLHACPGHEETCDPENMYEDIVAWACGEAIMNNTDIMLFDLDADPREETDISLSHPEVVASLLGRLEDHMAGLRPAQWPPADPEGADPDAWGGVWSPGWC